MRVISVVTQWPGATPQDVEKEILIQQEDYLGTVTGVTRMISSATTGEAAIELEFPKSAGRPIFMSTITTVVGIAPLVFFPGEGTELDRGVGAIVLFGLLFSTFVTLIFLPSLLALLLGLVERLRPSREER